VYNNCIMLIDFTFGNFHSFRDETTLSLIAIPKLRPDKALDEANTFPARKALNLLKVAGIYGPNASGKTNIVKAFFALREMVESSADQKFTLSSSPFLWDREYLKQPTFFEIRFILDGNAYRYGFELQVDISKERQFVILGEWLYRSVSAKESRLFVREGNNVEFGHSFNEASVLLQNHKIRREEALLLSLSAQIGGEFATRILNYITEHLVIISGIKTEIFNDEIENLIKKGIYLKEINQILQKADTGISQIEWREPNHNSDKISIWSEHKTKTGDSISLPFHHLESDGTKQLFYLSGPILDVLNSGSVLVIDEIDTHLHPLLTYAIIELFQSPKSNPKNAQLIFTTHDTNLLDAKRFRRDQIWFVEKDNEGASRLYSLADFKDVRKNSNYEQDYLEGRYGALPYIQGLGAFAGANKDAA
jgi:uncharacterized protein